jgi:PAS domain S-box-containing protein
MAMQLNSRVEAMSLRILCVEDETADSPLFSSLQGIQSPAAVCESVPTLAEAFIRLEQAAYDVVVAADKLPDGAGLAIIEAAHPTPVIFAATPGNEMLVVAAMEAGAADYVLLDEQGAYQKLLPYLIQRRMERSRLDKRLRAVEVERNMAGILHFDGDGIVLDCNDTAVELFQRKNKEALRGCTWQELFTQDFASQCQKLADGETLAGVSLTLLRPGRERRFAVANLARSHDAQKANATLFVTLIDVTEQHAAEEEIRRNETLYRTLVESLDISLCRWLPDTTILYSNDQYRAIFNVKNDSVGQKWLDFLPESTREETVGFYERLLQAPRAVTYEHSVLLEDGSERFFRWVDTPIRDKFGNVTEFQSIGIDITERKETEDALQRINSSLEQRVAERTLDLENANTRLETISQRLELATQAAGIGIWDLNLADNTLIIDSRMRELYGLEHKSYRDPLSAILEVVNPDDVPRLKSEFRRMLAEGGEYAVELRVGGPDRTERHLQVSAVGVRDTTGNLVRIVGISLDITTQKKVQEALRSALEKEKEFSTLKSRFVSLASHEFRTPLATILATAETLSIYRDRMSPEQLDARLEKIRQQVLYMEAVVDDVLKLEQIQTGRINFNPTAGNLRTLCQEIIGEFDSQPTYSGRIGYHYDPDIAETYFDSQLMRQAITNLVSNALKYSPDDMPVDVCLERQGTELILTVRDQGIGIPEEDQRHIFEPFHRGQNVGAASGTGLGLNIARQAVEMHQGTIAVESQLDMGSVFTLTVPMRCA